MSDSTPAPRLSNAQRRQAGEHVPLSFEDTPRSFFLRSDESAPAPGSGAVVSVGPPLPMSTAVPSYHGIATTWGSLLTAPSAPSCPVAASVGLVPKQPGHRFEGHGSEWLNATRMKEELGRRPTLLERPSLLNALAFKCKGMHCERGQCSLKLAEINVFESRQRWSAALVTGGYAASGSNRDPVLNTLVSHYDVKTQAFKNIEIDVQNNRGISEKVGLCVSTWAVVIANVGKGTMTKLRADAKKAACNPGSTSALQARLPLFDQCSKGLQQVHEKLSLLRSYVRDLCKTLEHNPVPGACRTVEYLVPRETWETRCQECEAHFAGRGV